MNPGKAKNISAAATTVVSSRPGTLKAIVVNTTAAGAITVYDNTAASGTKIATLKASIAEKDYQYNCRFVNGLTVVTAAASDITVVYD